MCCLSALWKGSARRGPRRQQAATVSSGTITPLSPTKPPAQGVALIFISAGPLPPGPPPPLRSSNPPSPRTHALRTDVDQQEQATQKTWHRRRMSHTAPNPPLWHPKSVHIKCHNWARIAHFLLLPGPPRPKGCTNAELYCGHHNPRPHPRVTFWKDNPPAPVPPALPTFPHQMRWSAPPKTFLRTLPLRLEHKPMHGAEQTRRVEQSTTHSAGGGAFCLFFSTFLRKAFGS